jgi:sodium/bile acid cotransporter 7
MARMPRTKHPLEEKPLSLPDKLKSAGFFILRQWLLIGICVACVLGYFFPNVAKSGGIIRAEFSILYGAVAVIFLVSGLSIPRDKLTTHALNWRLHVVVQGTSFLFVPALLVTIVHAILAGDKTESIDRSVLAGYILTACIPTTIASNVAMTTAAGGDQAAALVEVVVANFLGPFITPAWTSVLLPRTADFDVWRDSTGGLTSIYASVFEHLGLALFLPLIVGQIIRWTFPDQTAWVLDKFYLRKVSTVCLLLIIWWVESRFRTRIHAKLANRVLGRHSPHVLLQVL